MIPVHTGLDMMTLIVPGVAVDPSQSSVGGRREAGEQGAGGHPHQ